MAQWSSPGITENQSGFTNGAGGVSSAAWAQKGPRRVSEGEEREDPLAGSMRQSAGGEAGQRAWLAPVMWLQGREEVALPTCYYGSCGWPRLTARPWQRAQEAH